jgi:hypothetical protein
MDRGCCFRADIVHQMILHVCEVRLGNNSVCGEVGIEFLTLVSWWPGTVTYIPIIIISSTAPDGPWP